LHDNGFTVLTMADLAYDDKANHIYIKQFDEQGVSRKIVSVNEDSPSQVQTFSGHWKSDLFLNDSIHARYCSFTFVYSYSPSNIWRKLGI